MSNAREQRWSGTRGAREQHMSGAREVRSRSAGEQAPESAQNDFDQGAAPVDGGWPIVNKRPNIGARALDDSDSCSSGFEPVEEAEARVASQAPGELREMGARRPGTRNIGALARIGTESTQHGRSPSPGRACSGESPTLKAPPPPGNAPNGCRPSSRCARWGAPAVCPTDVGGATEWPPTRDGVTGQGVGDKMKAGVFGRPS